MATLLILFNFLSFSNNNVYSQTAISIKNNINGIRDNRGYTATVLQYDEMKGCTEYFKRNTKSHIILDIF